MHAGLGLAIVKEYVELMGGRIAVDSAPRSGEHLPGGFAGDVRRVAVALVLPGVDHAGIDAPALWIHCTTGPSAPVAGCKRVAAWKEDPEVRLMLRVKTGDEDAFTELQERYAPRIFGYFCRQLRDRSEAEDLTQEVFLRLYRSRERYEPRAQVRDVDLPHHPERGSQRLALAPSASVHSSRPGVAGQP